MRGYQKRISGPLLERIDIFVDVPRVDYEKLADERVGEKAESVRVRVETARDVQRQRFSGTKLACNNEMTAMEVKQFCPVDGAARALLRAAMKQMALSARAFHRVLKLSRTIADPSAGSGQALAGAEQIQAPHLAEAIQYRPRSLV